MSTVTIETFWTIEEVAQLLKVSVKTLYEWRRRGYGPKAHRMGKHLRYDPADIQAWIKTRKEA